MGPHVLVDQNGSVWRCDGGLRICLSLYLQQVQSGGAAQCRSISAGVFLFSEDYRVPPTERWPPPRLNQSNQHNHDDNYNNNSCCNTSKVITKNTNHSSSTNSTVTQNWFRGLSPDRVHCGKYRTAPWDWVQTESTVGDTALC